MRTTQRDESEYIVLYGGISGGASGTGFMLPGGVPFVWTRTGVGAYTIAFDQRLRVLRVLQTNHSGGRETLALGAGSGAVSFQVVTDTGVAADGDLSFSILVRDNR